MQKTSISSGTGCTFLTPRNRFADEGLLESREKYQAQVRQQHLTLFFVIHDGQRVAGGVASSELDVTRFRYLGIPGCGRHIPEHERHFRALCFLAGLGTSQPN